jgi:hypothetical protein
MTYQAGIFFSSNNFPFQLPSLAHPQATNKRMRRHEHISKTCLTRVDFKRPPKPKKLPYTYEPSDVIENIKFAWVRVSILGGLQSNFPL